MKKTLLFLISICSCLIASAQHAEVLWTLGDVNNLSASTITGDAQGVLTSSYLNGTNISKVEAMTGSNALSGYTAVSYDPSFAMYYVTTRQSGKTAGYCVSFGVAPSSGNTFKPTKLTFDAAKCGTDGGNFDVYVKPSGGTETALATGVAPLRNRIGEGNPDGYSHHEYTISDQLVEGKAFIVTLYIYNINGVDVTTPDSPKSIAFRNVKVEGMINEPIYKAEHYVNALTCKVGDETLDLMSLITGLGNGVETKYGTKIYADPTDFSVTPTEGYTADVKYSDKVATVTVKEAEQVVYTFGVRFVVSTRPYKPTATPLKRGLMAVNLSQSGSTGNLVSWRMRGTDEGKVKYKLYRGTSAEKTTTAVNSGKYITQKTNFRDPAGTSTSYYKLEVYDANDSLLETEVSGKTWANQTIEIPTSTPTDPHGEGATYTPNDASFCDMDGDGEYEIILKWSPSNEKDAASSGTTSDPFFDCYKLDGTRLWRIDLGPNFFTSAHTIQFIAWDLDGDGYGEFMCKTAPGTIDGQGNYVLLGDDSPTENLLSGRGKQDHGSEYITVFDGMTGAELSTIPYHTDYAAGQNYWGDSNQNRSERYLAALANLDGSDKNPSAIFARGYYSGAFIGAYDFDGEQLTCRWVHRAYSANNGVVEYADGTKKTINKTVYGEGAHWIAVGDVDGDDKQEIVYGSGCLDDDGTCLYRTGLEHGDALHLGDFDTERPGQEVFMVHEHKPYGMDLRDAKTGELLLHITADGDTGRGLIGHFDPNAESAYWQFSASSSLYDVSGGTVLASVSHGGGASLNNRIYWNGDLLDDYYDKSVLETYNNGFGRMQVNGGNYTIGTLNNSTKYNPCVLGDLLGDWREEIVTWNSSNNALIINATSYESDYKLPHLMENLDYRSQVVNQNCAYNQPPHLSYDPVVQLTKEYEIPASGWLPVCLGYPVSVVGGNASVYYVNALDANADTLKMKKITGIIPALTGVLLHGAPGAKVKLRPSATSAATISTNKLLGDVVPAALETTSSASFYRWETREGIGTGYFRVETDTCPAGEAYLKTTTATQREADYYLVGNTAVGVSSVYVDNNHPSLIYTTDGKLVDNMKAKGIYVKGNKKLLK